MFEEELDQSKIIFDDQMFTKGTEATPPINKNMPPVAGALKWSNELRERITKPMQALKLSLNHGLVVLFEY
jgi:dynein heavy chain